MEVIFNHTGAELRIEDGGTYKSATMLENSIEEDLGSISMCQKCHATSKSIHCLVVLNSHGEVACPKASWDNDLIGNY